MNKLLVTMAISVCCLGAPGLVYAQTQGGMKIQGADTEDHATQVLSDTLTYNDASRTTRFTGHVIMTRGLLTMVADRLDLREDAKGNQHGEATVDSGKRVQIRQENPEKFEVLIGLGEMAKYDGAQETFELIGRALLVRFICGKPFDTISAKRVRYDQKTDVYRAFGAADGQKVKDRVRSVAQPRSKIDAAIETCRQQQAAGIEPAPVPSMQ